MRKAYKLSSDADLARFLDKSTSTISTWRKRDALKIAEILEFVSDLNMNWLLFGDPPVWRKDLFEDPDNYLIAAEEGVEFIPGQKVPPGNFAAEVIARLEGSSLPKEVKIEIVKGLIQRLEERQQQLDNDTPKTDSDS